MAKIDVECIGGPLNGYYLRFDEAWGDIDELVHMPTGTYVRNYRDVTKRRKVNGKFQQVEITEPFLLWREKFQKV